MAQQNREKRRETQSLRLLDQESGAREEMPVGWNWTFFFLGWSFGIPLFLRRLYGLGALMAIILTGLLVARFYAIPPSGEEAERIAEEIIAALPEGASEDEVWRATWEHPAMIRASVAFVSQFLLMFAMMFAHLWICFKGNDRAVRLRLKRGWRFADAESESLWRARHPRWKGGGDS